MNGNLIEIIILGVVLFAVLMGGMQLLAAIWESRKPAPSKRAE